jgi:hypothetical protein
VPFLTLDAEHIEHSGTVLIVCADPRMIAGTNPPEPSRVQQLVARVRNEPGRPYGLSPHVIAVTCPPRMIGESAQQGRFVALNAPVLAGASQVIVEAHNGCAGLAHFYKGDLERLGRRGSDTPYFELQRQLLERGIERFAGRVAALSKRDLVVEANYVDFDAGGLVVDVTSIRTLHISRTKSAADHGQFWTGPA